MGKFEGENSSFLLKFYHFLLFLNIPQEWMNLKWKNDAHQGRDSAILNVQ